LRLRLELRRLKIATFNINGIKARLPRLLEWLAETRPTVACLQEIKCQDENFPIGDIEAAGYKAIWHGQKGFNGVAILADGRAPVEIRRGLAGEPEDEHSRYIEADVGGIRVACIYLPNGNPQPGPKFDGCAGGWAKSGTTRFRRSLPATSTLSRPIATSGRPRRWLVTR
jgi:exodeoxyribonuclease III